MKKQLVERFLVDLPLLRDWCLTIEDFIGLDYSQLPDECNMRTIILKVFDENWNGKYKKQQRKELLHDTNDMAMDLTGGRRKELNNILRQRFGFDLDAFSNLHNKRIQSVIKRGKIKNDEEFILLKDKVEEIYADDNQQELLATLNNLLYQYEFMNER